MVENAEISWCDAFFYFQMDIPDMFHKVLCLFHKVIGVTHKWFQESI